MVNPTVKRSSNKSNHSKERTKTNSLPLAPRRFVAWAVEIALVITSGLVPLTMGVYANSRKDLDQVPLSPVLVVTQRAIAQPLALPIGYDIYYVSSATNFLWTVALFLPITLSSWQLLLLAKTGSTIPKRWFGIRVLTKQGKPPGWGAALVREGIGRWGLPISGAYLLWRYCFFPNLGLFILLAMLMVLGEGVGWPFGKQRRAFHDLIAKTYTVNATRPLAYGTEPSAHGNGGLEMQTDQLPTDVKQPNSNVLLAVVAFVSMAAVLSTLVGTQIYIQTQETQRRTEQVNSQQFLALTQQLNPDSRISNEDRQRVILALGSLNDSQAAQYLVDLLVKETDPNQLDTIQQALANLGIKAIPELKRMNQFLASELNSVGSNQNREDLQRQLNLSQRAINKILTVYSGKLDGIDLSQTQLSSEASNLVLDNTDLSGVDFKAANLDQASFQGTRFRGTGEDRRWDNYNDAIADLSQAQLQQANFTGANLSRVLMNHSDLSRATLNRAILASARLLGANLSSTQLVGADFQGAALDNASLTGADLSDAKFNGASLSAAHLVRVTAIGTQLSDANLSKTDWQGADLSESYLERANLNDANLSNTSLAGAILRSAQMANADLRNTDLSRADLRGANVAGADFQGAMLFRSKQDPADQFVQTPDLGSQSAVIKGVDFTQAKNLDAKQLAFICTQGGIYPRCP